MKINFVHTHRFIRVPLYSFASCAAPKLHDQPNKREIYIYLYVNVYEFMSISHEMRLLHLCLCGFI